MTFRLISRKIVLSDAKNIIPLHARYAHHQLPGVSNNISLSTTEIELNDTIFPLVARTRGKNCIAARCPALERDDRGALSVHDSMWPVVIRTECTGVILSFRGAHTDLLPYAINAPTYHARWPCMKSYRGDRNEVTHTSTCGPIALEIFSRALRPPAGNLRRADPRMTKRIIASGFIGVAPI